MAAKAPEEAQDDFSKACQMAAKWNAQLRQVRQARGPQWDYATRLYHVPKGSEEYYSNVTPAEPSQSASNQQQQHQQHQQQHQPEATVYAKRNNDEQYDSGRPRRRGAANRSYAEGVWSAPPLLTAKEKGYTDQELQIKVVDLLNGDNFSPAFLRSTSDRAPTVTVLTSNKVQPKATLPVLVLPLEITVDETIPTKYRAVTNTIDVVSFLDTATLSSSFSAPSLSPATVQGSNDAKALIERVHAPDAPDPNALLLSFRDDSERKAKLDQIAGPFLRGRIAAIEKFAAENDPKLAAFYAQKLQENKYLLSLFEGQTDASQYQEQAKQMWTQAAATTAFFEERLQPDSDYLLGDLSLADLHAGAFFARMFACAGAKSIQDPEGAVGALEHNIGRPVGQPFKSWIARLFDRESFKQVYAEGLH